MNNELEFVNCILCQKNSSLKIIDFESDGKILSIVRCKICQLIYTNPRLPSTERILKTKGYFTKSFVEYYRASRLSIFKEYISMFSNYPKGSKLLDVGCGSGFFLDIAREAGFQVYGIEISPYVKEIIDKIDKDIELFIGETKNAPWPDDIFDIITLFDVIYYFNNPLDEMQKVNKMLKKDGILIIRFPLIGDFLYPWLKIRKFFLKSNFFPSEFKSYTYFFSINTILQLLKNSGFSNFKIMPSPVAVWKGYSLLKNLVRKIYYRVNGITIFLLGGKIVFPFISITITAKKN